MRIADKTKEQLVEELEALRLRTAELEHTEAARKRREEAIRKLEEEKLSILDRMSEHVVYQNSQHRILWANKAAAEAAGLPREQLVGCYCYEVRSKRSEPCVDCPVAKARETGKPQASEITTPDGRVWFVQGYPIRDTEDQIVGLVEVALEVTERKQVEEVLRKGERKFELLFESTLDGMFVLDAETLKVVLANQAAVDIYGLNSVEEAIGLNVLDCVPPEERERVLRLVVKDMFENDLRQVSEFRGIARDGREIWVSAVGTRTEYRGKLAGLISFSDITERKQAEETLQTEKNKLQSVVDAIEYGLSIQDRDYNILYQSQPMVKATGYHLGEKCYQAYEGRDTVCDDCPVEKAFKDGKSHTSERKIVTPSGRVVFLEHTAGPIRNAEGKVVSCLEIPRNVTERKQAEEALADEATRRRILIDQSRDGIVVLDENGKVYEANQRFAEMLGYTPEEVTQLYVWDWEYLFSREQVQEMIRTVDEVGDHFETRHRRKDGTTYDVEISTNGAVFAGQKLVFCVCRDITERKKAEEALREGEEKYRTIFENVSDVIIRVDRYGKIVDINGKAEECFGYKPKEVIGKNFAKLGVLSLKDLPKIVRLFGEVIRGKRAPLMVELEAKRRDGSPVLIEVTSKLVKKNGKAEGFVAIVRDITERKQAEEAVRESEEKLRTMFESVTDGISVVNLDGIITDVNQRTVEMHGFSSRDEILGKSAIELIAPRDHKRALANMRKALTQGIIKGMEYTLLKADGSEFPGELSTNVLKDAAGKAIGHITIARDIANRKEVEELYRTLANSSPVGVYIIQDGKFQFVNSQFQKYTGFSEDELLDRESLEIVHPEDKERVRENAVDMLKGKRLSPYELRYIVKSGEILWATETVTSINYRGQRAVLGNFMDVTERKQTEEALERQRAYFQQLFDNSPEAIVLLDTNNQIVNTNKGFETLFGYTLEEVKGRPLREVIVPEDHIQEAYNLSQAFLNNEVVQKETVRKRKDGSRVEVALLTYPIRFGSRTVGAYVIYRDITGRKRDEAKLKESEERYRNLFEGTHDMIQSVAPDGHIIFANRAWLETLGYTEAELPDLNLFQIIHPESLPHCQKMFDKVMTGESVNDAQATLVAKDGRSVIVEGTAIGRYIDGKLVATQGIFRDITERKRAEEELKLRAQILDSATDSIFVHDADDNFVYVNEAACRAHGYSRKEFMKMKIPQLVDPKRAHPLASDRQEILDKGYIVTESAHLRKDGSIMPVEIHARTLESSGGKLFITVARDITERKRAEDEREEMEQKAHLASRLASVGEMASGIAHEINNPLTSVIGFSQLLMEGDIPADVKEDVNIIYKEAQRAAGVAKNLLTFARKQSPAKQPTNINSIIDGVLKLRAYEQRVNNIQVDSQLAPDLPEVMADYSQLQQVFINLIINAESAMIEANKGGTLTITTQKVNKTVRASFSDDGPGITPENLNRIFDPFFTTKEVGKGTGLGLSVCHGIVAEHNGKIYARSKPGKGATFVVELPVSNS